MSARQVTEQDFRLPEYRDAKTEDFEFRSDGKLVRKDRWEQGIMSIVAAVGMSTREFEIPDVVDAVRRLAEAETRWTDIEEDDRPPAEDTGNTQSIRLEDGSVLKHAVYLGAVKGWSWNEARFGETVKAWREEYAEPSYGTGHSVD